MTLPRVLFVVPPMFEEAEISKAQCGSIDYKIFGLEWNIQLRDRLLRNLQSKIK